MLRFVFISALACLAGSPALADKAIGGWAVSDKPDSDGTCAATHAYNDADDSNKKNSVVLGLVKNPAGAQLVMVLGYEDWSFDKGQAIVGDLVVDSKTVYKNWKWEGDGTVLTSVFSDTSTLVPMLGASKKIIVRFGKDGEANFQVPNAGMALGAVTFCMG